MSLELRKTGLKRKDGSDISNSQRLYMSLWPSENLASHPNTVVKPKIYNDRNASDVQNNYANPMEELHFEGTTLVIRSNYIIPPQFPTTGGGSNDKIKYMTHIHDEVIINLQFDNPGIIISKIDI